MEIGSDYSASSSEFVIAFVSWNAGKVQDFFTSNWRHERAPDFEVSSWVYKKQTHLSLHFSISYILLEILIFALSFLNCECVQKTHKARDFKSSKQLFEELIQSNRFAFTKWIPLNRKAYKYSQLIDRKNPTSILCVLIELRIPFLVSDVSLSYKALISDRKMRRVLKLYTVLHCTLRSIHICYKHKSFPFFFFSNVCIGAC